MPKVTITPLGSLSNETAAINTLNTNFNNIVAGIDLLLSRDGESPNALDSDIDMNSQRILNLPEPQNNTEPARKIDLDDLATYVDGEIADLTSFVNSSIASLTSALNAGINSLTNQVNNAVSSLTSLVNNSVSSLTSFVNSSIASLSTSVTNAVNSLTAMVNDRVSLMDSYVAAVVAQYSAQNTLEVVFGSRAAVELSDIDAVTNYIVTQGYAISGDGGGGVYKRSASEPSHPGKVQSADGAWWELTGNIVNSRMFGAAGDGVADDTAALQDLADYPGGSVKQVLPGSYTVDGLNITGSDENWQFLSGAVVKHKDAATATCITVTGENVVIDGLVGDGNKANIVDDRSFLILDQAHHSTVQNTQISNAAHYGIWARDTDYVTVRNIRILESRSFGIWISVFARAQEIVSPVVTDIYIDRTNSDSATAFSALKIQGGDVGGNPYICSKPFIRGVQSIMPFNTVDGAAMCLEMSRVEDAQLHDITTYGGRMGVSIPRSHRCVMSNLNLVGWVVCGIELPSCQDVVINNFVIDGLDNTTGFGRGIILDVISGEPPSHNAKISNGIIRRCLRGIHAGGDATTGDITGGIVSNVQVKEFKDATRYAFYLTRANGWVFNSCDVSGRRTDGSDGLSGAPLTCQISKNVLWVGGRIDAVTHLLQLIGGASAYTFENIEFRNVVFTNVNTQGILTGTFTLATMGSGISFIECPGILRNSRKTDFLDWTAVLLRAYGTGTPEGVVTAGVGSTYIRTDGAANTTYYVKESGTGNTGWVAK